MCERLFSGEEKKLFDAHMKIHFDHWCPSCNYSSRTEGRLRCHIKMFHSKPESSASGENANKKRQKSKISCRHCDFTTKIKVSIEILFFIAIFYQCPFVYLSMTLVCCMKSAYAIRLFVANDGICCMADIFSIRQLIKTCLTIHSVTHKYTD